jgi:hypothetical protein
MEIAVLDFYGSLVVTDNSSVSRVSISTEDQACLGLAPYITGDPVEKIEKGRAVFSQIEVHCIPNGYLTTEIDTTYLDFTGNIGIFTSVLQLSFRTCVRGEYYTNGDCLLCPEGKYSLESNAALSVTECSKCPDHAETCYGDDIKVDNVLLVITACNYL